MDYRFKIAARARSDIRNIWQYIARDNVLTANLFRDRLLLAAESLQNFPHRHGNFPKRPSIRKVAFDTYLIIYKINEESRTVEILRFWHSARDQHHLRLKEENGKYVTTAILAP